MGEIELVVVAETLRAAASSLTPAEQLRPFFGRLVEDRLEDLEGVMHTLLALVEQ